MVRVREIVCDRSEHVSRREAGGSRDELHQRTNLSGRSTFSINDRVRQVGNIADDTDTRLHADDTFFDERRTQVIKYPLPCIESREQANNQDAPAHKDTNQGDDPTSRACGSPGCRHWFS